ncbi:MAG TPA: dienelactone hydrolase family protein [Minicystis sp.]|nr:dienelactone hydrolase family protein [Minicystis sp.]
MSPARSFVLLAAALSVAACGRSSSAAPAGASASAAPAAENRAAAAHAGPEAAGVRYEVKLFGGATSADRVPMIVAMHGMGDSPEGFGHTFSKLTARVRVVLPYGLLRYEPTHGYRWFDTGKRDDAAFSAGVREAAPKLVAFLDAITRELPTVGKPIVTGFSQGATMTQALAVLAPDRIELAVPVSGFLPKGVTPERMPAGARTPEVFVLHGEDDDIVPIGWDEAGVAALQRLGFHVVLERYPGVKHVFGSEEYAAYLALLDDTAARIAK